jgi:hypothetical protein
MKLRTVIAIGSALIAIPILALVAWVANFTSHPIDLITVAMMVVMALVFFALVRSDLDSLISVIDELRFAFPLFAYLLVATFVASSPGTPTFHEIGAQIIVILLLALAIDARFFRLRSSRNRMDKAGILFTMAVLAVGEFFALHSVGTGHPKYAGVVAGAIAAGFVAVATSAFVGPTDSPEQNRLENSQ